MTRPSRSRPTRRGSKARPSVESLEGRSLPSGIGFTSALGLGVTGTVTALHSNAVATDPAGDTYVTGSFRGTSKFDPASASATYTTANTQDAFVAKYGPTGSLIWARTFAGQTTTNSGGFTTYAVSQGSAIRVDGSGNLFVAGSFTGTINLTGASGVTQATSAASSTQAYVARLDASGNVTWFDAVGGTAYDTDAAYGLALDGSGGAVIAGVFSDQATFGPTTLTSTGSSDAFAARVNGSGTFLWAVATRGVNGSNAQINGVAIDPSGHVDLAGFFSGTVDFDPSASNALLAGAGSDDALLWKLDGNGNFLWARDYGSVDYDASTAVAVDASGNLYATGAFSDTVNFGTSSKPDAITAGSGFDTFLLKVDPSGNEVWVQGLVDASGSSKGQGVAVDPLGTVHVVGTFSGPLDFDPGPGTDLLTSVATSDAFEAGYDSTAGTLIYALQAGQTNFNAALGVAADSSGNVAITGTYTGSIAFGPATLPTFAGGSIFMARAVTQVAPPSPSAPVLDPSSDTGISHTDGITSVTSPVLDVNTAVASDTVELLRNGIIVAHRTGPGSLLDAGPLLDGTYTYTAVQVSASGLASPVSPGCSVTILTATPATLPAPTLFPGDDSGLVGDGITNVAQPRLLVVAKGATTVQLVDPSGTTIGSTSLVSDGTVVVVPYQALADGTYQIRARAVDLAGNVGPPGPAFSLTIDTTPPVAPPASTLLAADDSGTVGDNLTNVRQPRLTGRAEPGSTLTLVDGLGNVVGTSTVAQDGTYTTRVLNSLADGTYQFSARATDAAGNIGPLGTALSLTILATPPPMPSTLSIVAADVSGPSGGSLTNVRQPRITGSAKAGTTVDLFNSSGALLAFAVAGQNGVYTAKISSPLADGPVTLDAVAIDAAGNRSPASSTLTLTIDTTPPVAPPSPTLLAADDSGTVGDNLTNVRQPRLTGRAEPGSTVTLVDGLGNVVGTSTVAQDGTYTTRVLNSLADGTYQFSARATDAAGNIGPLGTALSLTILATPPAAPAAPAILPSDDSGGPGLTNVRQPRLTGHTGANFTVQLFGAGGVPLGSTFAGSDGSYVVKVTSALNDGTYSIDAVVTDLAGNLSNAGSALSLTILATPPAAPSSPTLLAQDDSGTVGDRITNIRQPRLTGTAKAGLLVRLVNSANQVLGTATASGTGTGSVTLSPLSPLADGTYSLNFVAVDAAGNVSPAGGSIILTILATPPPPPSSPTLLASDDTGVSGDGMTTVRRPRIVGTAVPGGRIDWLASDGSILASATASSPGGSYQLQPSAALPNGVYPVRVRETDVAGNASTTSPTFNLTVRVALGDDFGDSRSDVAIFRQSDAVFFIQKPTNGALFQMQFGGPGDVPINGDFFGNGHNDIAIYRPSTSTFYLFDPVTGAFKTTQFGGVGDIPVPGDFDGDGQTDIAVFRPSTSTFYIQMSSTNTTTTRAFGGLGDIPVPADYFGNGHVDLAVYRPSTATFFVYDPISGSTKVAAVGAPGGTPVPADYEGIGHVDPAIYQSSTSTFLILMSATNTVLSRPFGGPGDIPVPGDYLGNGRADLAVYRPSSATFYALDINTSAAKVVAWGTPNVTMPTLSPITLWFSFGGGSKGSASGRPGSSSLGVSAEFAGTIELPLSPDLLPSTAPTTPAKSPVRAVPALDLESWRPGV